MLVPLRWDAIGRKQSEHIRVVHQPHGVLDIPAHVCLGGRFDVREERIRATPVGGLFI